MGMKEERTKHAQAAQDKLYDAIDERNNWKEPSKKQVEEKKKKEEVKKVPENCQNCRYRINMCWMGKIRNQGQNFICVTKQIDATIKQEGTDEKVS